MRRIEPRTDGPTRAGRRLRSAAFALAAGVLVASAATAVTVDDLATAQGPLSTAATTSSSVPAPTALGLERDMEVSLTAGAGPVTADVGVTTATALTFASPAGTAGMLEVQWDGVDTSAGLDPTGLGGVDLTAGGDDALQVVVNSATAGAILKITVYTDAQQLSIFRRALPAIAAPTTLNVAYADFLGNADFSNVGAVVLMLSGDGVAVELGTPIATGTGAVSVSATKAAAIAIASDADADGEVDPGEQIEYTVEITSTGTTATTLDLTDTVDANTTFVGGSVETTPLALDDSYSSLGNVGISVPAGSGLLVNDTDPDGSGLAATPISAFDSMSAEGGTVSVTAADGAFTYTPPPGFAGVDFFSYTLADGEGNTDVGTVAITVADRIWFIDNGAGAAGNGTLATPFNTLAAFEAINGSGGATDPAAGDCIYVDTGGGNYAGGVTLEAGQLLIGQGATGGTLQTLCSVTPPTHSATLPTLAGTKPTIVNTGGNGITLASGNTVRGLDVGATSGAGIFGNFGTLTVRDVAVNGSGNILDLANGTLDAVFDSLTTTSATTGIKLATVGGSLTVTDTGSDTAISGATTAGIDIQSSPAGASFNFADTTVGASLGVNLASNAAASTITFKSLAVTSTAGAGLAASSNGTINIGGTANTIAATGGPALDVSTTTLNDLVPSGGVTFATVTSASSPSRGINLDTVSGSVTINDAGGGSSITGATGTAFRVNAGASDVTYAGTITNTAARTVEVTSRTGGTVTLSDTVTDNGGTGIRVASGVGTVRFTGTGTGRVDLNNTSGTAVTVQNMTGGTTSFADLDVNNSTSNQTGLLATSNTGHTLSADDGDIDAGSGRAVDIDNTNLANTAATAAGFTLASVRSVGGSAPGIDLNTTTGAFTVAGSGDAVVDCRNSAAACAGGAITGKTGAAPGVDGVLLSNVTNVNLNEMNISSNSRNGVFGTTVNGFTIDDSRLVDNTDQADPNENGINFDGLTGTAVAGANPTKITNTRIQDSHEHNVEVRNSSGTLTELRIEGSIFTNDGGSTEATTNLNFLSQGTASMGLNVIGSEFIGNRTPGFLTASGIFADGQSTATLDVTITTSLFEDNNNAINVSHSGSGGVTFDISDNGTMARPIVGNLSAAEAAGAGGASTAINVVMSTTYSGSASGVIHNNFIGNDTVVESGAATARGILADMDGSGTLRVEITDNTIRQVDSNGIRSWTQETDGGDIFVKVTGNSLRNVTSTGIYIRSRDGGANTLCAIMASNTADATVTGTHVRLREDTGTVTLEPGTSASSDATQVLTDLNPGAASWDGDTANVTVGSNGDCAF